VQKIPTRRNVCNGCIDFNFNTFPHFIARNQNKKIQIPRLGCTLPASQATRPRNRMTTCVRRAAGGRMGLHSARARRWGPCGSVHVRVRLGFLFLIPFLPFFPFIFSNKKTLFHMNSSPQNLHYWPSFFYKFYCMFFSNFIFNFKRLKTGPNQFS
jgi:hypothetical protein